MQDFIRRDLNIFSEPNTEAPTTTLLNPDGSPVTVAQISAPFTTSAANVIGVTGSFNNACTTVALTSGQDISGGNSAFILQPGGGAAATINVVGAITQNTINGGNAFCVCFC